MCVGLCKSIYIPTSHRPAGPATLKPAGSAMPPSRVSNGYALRTRSTQICQGPQTVCRSKS